MKKRWMLVTVLVFLLSGNLLSVLLAEDEAEKPGEGDWEIPLAAGVWYPDDGPLEAAPMRYYRVRCWPGCHSGSPLGLYPKRNLADDHPIFPTSTAGAVSENGDGEASNPQSPSP